MKKTILLSAGSLLVVGLTGCASVSPELAFQDVAEDVRSRTGKQIKWDPKGPYQAKSQQLINRRLSRRLTPSAAAQIALLNNKSLQATYASLGIAQADVVQAGLLTNPSLDGAILWPYKPEAAAANIALGTVFNFISLVWKRHRQAVATSALEETKIKVSGAVIDLASDTYRAYFDYVAARQEVSLLRDVEKTARATLTAAKAIREAGNSTPLEFEQQQNVLTQAKLDLAIAVAREAETRETLNVLMGLAGRQTKRWSAPRRLRPARDSRKRFSRIERRAVDQSLNLAELRQRLITLGYTHQLTNKQALIPSLRGGVEWEKTEDERELGLTFDVTLPLFDQGQAKKARSIMEIRQAQDQYWAMGVKVRSAARVARAEFLTAAKTAIYYRRAIIPQQNRLLRATQQQYNAMQRDVFGLVRAKREQILAQRRYISALRAYWRARINLQQILSGRLPGEGGGPVMVASAPAEGGDEGGH